LHTPDSCQEKSSSIPRNDHQRKKRGTKENGTEASHIISYSILNKINSHKPGPKFGKEKTKEITKSFNKDDNLRIKSFQGNRSTDNKLDNQIIKKMDTGKPLTKTESDRARQQATIFLNSKGEVPDSIIKTARERYSNLEDNEGHKIIRKNSTFNEPIGSRAFPSNSSNVDMRSSAVRQESLQFNKNGTVDRSCSAVKNHDILVTKNGFVDGRSRAVKSGEVFFKGSSPNSSNEGNKSSSNSSSSNRASKSSSSFSGGNKDSSNSSSSNGGSKSSSNSSSSNGGSKSSSSSSGGNKDSSSSSGRSRGGKK